MTSTQFDDATRRRDALFHFPTQSIGNEVLVPLPLPGFSHGFGCGLVDSPDS